MDVVRLIYQSLLRGTALFFGFFSLLNLGITYFGSSRFENIWWIDISWLPSPLPLLVSIAAAGFLLLFALYPYGPVTLRRITAYFFFSYVLISLINSLSFYKGLAEGVFSTPIYVPFSLVITLVVAASGLTQLFAAESQFPKTEILITIIVGLFWIALFPLSQIQFFGNTDYTRKADAAVVFGARYYGDGNLSTSLKNRMDKGIELIEDGYVDYLILTGGVDADGLDETVGMKDYAIARGLNSAQLIIDNEGKNTDLSVTNTVQIAKERDLDTILAVSHNYHLPRIKMAFRAARLNVYTVPVVSTVSSSKDWELTLREIPSFWVYYFRSALRDITPSIVQ